MVMTIKESGFCHGVRAAVHRANEQSEAAEKGQRVYLYGDLVNNRHVMASYKRRGFTVTEEAGEIAPGSVVIIRAHGAGESVYRALAEKNARVIDCTCPKVKSIHRIAAEKSAAGYKVVIVGKSGHPEVLGIFGWCRQGSALVAESEADLAAIGPDEPVCAVGQTTCKKTWWEKAVAIVKEKNPQAEIFNTLCDVTAQRIGAAVEIAKKSDVTVVVGDEKSANSLELYDACGAVCANVLFVSSLEDLVDAQLAGAAIGLVGSASAPADIIDEIHGFLLFTNFLARAKGEIEAASDNFLGNLLRTLKEKPIIEATARSLREQNQGGKRIRGALIKLGEEIAGAIASTGSQRGAGAPPGGQRVYLPVAMAYELFQTSILIHDDIIDKSPVRRGKATIHAAEGDPHFGTSRAICVGDYGLFLANKILAESDLEPRLLAKVFRLFSQIQLTTLEGEIMDVTLPRQPMDIAANYEEYTGIVGKIFEYKTAWYTLAGPLMLGALCGGADGALLGLLRDIALPLGVAFQIKDDLLGIYAGEEALGKPALSDIIERKQTLLYGYACKHAGPAQKRRLDAVYGSPAADARGLETVREIFAATGARAFAEGEIRRLSRRSLDLIAQLPAANAAQGVCCKSVLRGLVHYLITRRF